MTILVGKSYANINIPEGETQVCLPLGFNSPICPGAFKGVTKIRFNNEFNCELEPGVITDEVTTLILGSGFKHKLGPGIVPASTKIYVYTDNREFAPTDRPFALYRKCGDGGMIHFSKNDKAKWIIEEHPAWSKDSMFSNVYQYRDEDVMVGINLWTSYITPRALVVEPAIKPTASASESTSDIEVLRQELAQANLKIDAMTESFNQKFSELKRLILTTGGFM